MARTQDYGLGEFTFPRGWFMVADAEELKDRPLPVRFLGRTSHSIAARAAAR